ncbi:hypothetical protein B0H11DRAFT_2299864 [Mycena galericulata]|nr:hypothetical protein B0H11DRAFT_2299864 [Mycena galericulata]
MFGARQKKNIRGGDAFRHSATISSFLRAPRNDYDVLDRIGGWAHDTCVAGQIPPQLPLRPRVRAHRLRCCWQGLAHRRSEIRELASKRAVPHVHQSPGYSRER